MIVSSGMLSAAASLGMILLWDVDGGLTQIDKYLYSSEDYIKVWLLWKCIFLIFLKIIVLSILYFLLQHYILISGSYYNAFLQWL